jgi:hypothetical protein
LLLGHEDPFLPPELSVCWVFRRETFAGRLAMGEMRRKRSPRRSR